MERYADPNDPLNSPRYHSGKKCVVKGCTTPSGTHWSPYWCQPHNAARMDRISAGLKHIADHYGIKT